jgi:hypothetical protein
MSKGGFSVTACLNIAAACESYLDTTERWETAKGEAAETKKARDEARDAEAEAVGEAKESHGDKWPPEVCEHITELNEGANAAHTMHEIAARERDKLSKLRAKLLERWLHETKQAIELGDLFGAGTKGGDIGDAWKGVSLACVAGDLLADTFASADPSITTIGEFCDIGRSPDFGRLIEEGVFPPSIARVVADQVRSHLKRNGLGNKYPRKLDATIAEFMGKAGEAPEPGDDADAREDELAEAYAE